MEEPLAMESIRNVARNIAPDKVSVTASIDKSEMNYGTAFTVSAQFTIKDKSPIVNLAVSINERSCDLSQNPRTLATAITNFEGKRRQMQFVGKLMRQLDADTLQAVREALDVQRHGSAKEAAALHEAELWRDRLVADDEALGEWLNLYPDTDAQQLRALVRQARKDAKPEKPGEALRHGRAYRDIFQLVKEHMAHG